MNKFKEKVAIVTGGGSGFGRLVAQLYAKEGAKVVVADINEKGGAETVTLIKGDGGEATFVRTDVSNPLDCENLVKKSVQEYGRLDIAFNNAGITGADVPIADYPIDVWNKIIGINLSSVFFGMHYQIPEMLKNGGGIIVNMSSILGQVGFAGASGYVAAKHGVVGLTKTAALEYANKGIRVNAVGPGFADTPLLKDDSSEEKKVLVSKHPMGRLGKPEEIANLVIWLSSDQATFCNGGFYSIDGGYLAQ